MPSSKSYDNDIFQSSNIKHINLRVITSFFDNFSCIKSDNFQIGTTSVIGFRHLKCSDGQAAVYETCIPQGKHAFWNQYIQAQYIQNSAEQVGYFNICRRWNAVFDLLMSTVASLESLTMTWRWWLVKMSRKVLQAVGQYTIQSYTASYTVLYAVTSPCSAFWQAMHSRYDHFSNDTKVRLLSSWTHEWKSLHYKAQTAKLRQKDWLIDWLT